MHQKRPEAPMTHYDPSKDSLYVDFKPGYDFYDGFSFEFARGLIVDTDWSGKIVGVEIRDAKRAGKNFFNFSGEEFRLQQGRKWTHQLACRDINQFPMDRVRFASYFIDSYLVR